MNRWIDSQNSSYDCFVSYRYHFNGQEVDEEANEEWYAYEYRLHDARIGRFWSVDPLADKYPFNSPYAFCENSVIAFIELEGLEKYYSMDGRYFHTVAGEKSDEIRMTNLSYDDGVALTRNTADYEAVLYANSTIAYTTDQEQRMMDDWALLNKPLSQHNERGMVVYCTNVTNDDGSSMTLLVPGSPAEGNSGGVNGWSVDMRQSKLVVGGKLLGTETRNGALADKTYNLPDGWKRHSMIHTHPQNGSVNMSQTNGGMWSADINLALEWNIPVSMVHYSHDWVKTFYPKFYYANTCTRPGDLSKPGVTINPKEVENVTKKRPINTK